MSRDEAHVLDALKAARSAGEFVGSMDRTVFLADAKSQSAALHQLMVLGEAVKRLSPDYRANHQDIPWKLIAGARDRLIHAYDAVDLEEVWMMVTRDIPELIERLERLAHPSGPA